VRFPIIQATSKHFYLLAKEGRSYGKTTHLKVGVTEKEQNR